MIDCKYLGLVVLIRVQIAITVCSIFHLVPRFMCRQFVQVG